MKQSVHYRLKLFGDAPKLMGEHFLGSTITKQGPISLLVYNIVPNKIMLSLYPQIDPAKSRAIELSYNAPSTTFSLNNFENYEIFFFIECQNECQISLKFNGIANIIINDQEEIESREHASINLAIIKKSLSGLNSVLIEIKNSAFFEVGVPSGALIYSIKSILLKDTVEVRPSIIDQIIQVVTEGTEIVSTIALGSLLIGLLAGADPSLVWGFVSLLQMFYYLLFLNVKYPENLKQFFRIFSMGRLQFLPSFGEDIF